MSSVSALGRVAIVHDYLSQFGGAERVALAMADHFKAPIFTSIYQPDGTFAEFQGKEVSTTYLQKIVPAGRFRFFAPFIGRAMRTLDLSSFDTVIVSSSGFAHHAVHTNAYVYCHTPPRFIYDIDHYFANPLLRRAVGPALPWLRRKDQQAALQHHHYAANSAKTAALIHRVYGKVAPILHPPLHTNHLPSAAVPLPKQPRALIITRLQPYKRVDLAIDACARAGIPLTVVGSGMSERALRAHAVGDVTFAGRVDDAELPTLFEQHSIVLTPGVEDFGFAPIEANYAGRPVLARMGGGALETVKDGITGRLVPTDDVEVWADLLREALAQSWDPVALRASTAPYQLEAFNNRLVEWIHTSQASSVL